jgi:hypothetical protein
VVADIYVPYGVDTATVLEKATAALNEYTASVMQIDGNNAVLMQRPVYARPCSGGVDKMHRGGVFVRTCARLRIMWLIMSVPP